MELKIEKCRVDVVTGVLDEDGKELNASSLSTWREACLT